MCLKINTASDQSPPILTIDLLVRCLEKVTNIFSQMMVWCWFIMESWYKSKKSFWTDPRSPITNQLTIDISKVYRKHTYYPTTSNETRIPINQATNTLDWQKIQLYWASQTVDDTHHLSSIHPVGANHPHLVATLTAHHFRIGKFVIQAADLQIQLSTAQFCYTEVKRPWQPKIWLTMSLYVVTKMHCEKNQVLV